MLDTAQLQQLKRTNVSVDSEKTKQRVTDLWKGLKIKKKQEIRELAGTTAQPIYRTQETGNISARMAIAFAQSLGVSPAYIIGEVDEPGECTEVAIRDLLLKYGYRELAASIVIPADKPAKRKYERRTKPEAVEAAVDASEEEKDSVEEPAPQPEPAAQLPPGSDTLTSDELQRLIDALYIQAKAGIASSKEKLEQIKLIMLT